MSTTVHRNWLGVHGVHLQ